jgi:hypothetical protein
MAGEDLQIELVRSGGFAGMSVPVHLGPGELEPEEAAEVERLLPELEALGGASGASGGGASGAPAGGADRFQYDLTVVRGDRRHHVTVGEGNLTRDQRALFKRLMARRRAG